MDEPRISFEEGFANMPWHAYGDHSFKAEEKDLNLFSPRHRHVAVCCVLFEGTGFGDSMKG